MLVGLRTLRQEPVLGLKRLALPVGYWRAVEFAYVWRQLRPPAGARVLDIGSPKDLAAMLAYHRGYEVVATDILPTAVLLSRRYGSAQGLEGHGRGRVHSEVQDARALTYADDSFDAAYSVSVLEHIPDDGDSAAMRELIRVVAERNEETNGRFVHQTRMGKQAVRHLLDGVVPGLHVESWAYIAIEESMMSMCERVPNLDLRFFVTSVAIQRQTGGDLAEILDKIGYVVRERYRILGQVKALTGEGRLSGVVLIALPFALFGFMLNVKPDYVELLWTTELGIKMSVAAIIAQIIGALVIRKIVNIKV